MKCKHCGSDVGFYTKLKGVQYYDNNAEPKGFDVYTQGVSVYCQNCDKRAFSTSDFISKDEAVKK